MLALVVVFGAVSFWILRSPAVIWLTFAAILLPPVLFDISELSVGKDGIKAKIRNVEEKVEEQSQRIKNLQDKMRLRLASEYGKET